MSRIQAVPDRTDSHTWCTLSLPSLQPLLFCESSLSLSNPSHGFCSVTTSPCSSCSGLGLPSPPHPQLLTSSPHCPAWNQQEVKELGWPHRLTSPPQTLCVALSQVSNTGAHTDPPGRNMVVSQHILGSCHPTPWDHIDPIDKIDLQANNA